MLKTVVSTTPRRRPRAQFLRDGSCGLDFGPGFFESGRPDAQGDSETEKVRLELEARKIQKLSGFTQVDLFGQIGLQDLGVRLLSPLLLIDSALRQSPEETEIQEVHENEGLVTGAFDDRDLATMYAVRSTQ